VLSSDLSNKISRIGKVVNSGSIWDIYQSGIYYVTGNVTDRPDVLDSGAGGMYLLGGFQPGTHAGIYISEYVDRAYIIKDDQGQRDVYNILLREYQYSATTSSTGAVPIATPVSGRNPGLDGLHFVSARLYTGDPGFVVIRDAGYFTVFNNDGTVKANTNVEFYAYFL
jgi:hypothetical protein